MIISFIFFAHFVFSVIVFIKKWQQEGATSGWLSLGLIGLVFAVGWPLIGMIAKLVMANEGFGLYFDRDTFTLTTLTILEFFFYKMYFSDIFGKEQIKDKDEN